MKYLLIIVFAFSTAWVYAQSDNNHHSTDKKTKYNAKGDPIYPEITFSKESKKSIKHRKKKGRGMYNDFDKKVDEYYARMEENQKKYAKMEKEMKKPQYSDPTYFGHKHPPKKRPPGKKKFCKVCGMWH